MLMVGELRGEVRSVRALLPACQRKGSARTTHSRAVCGQKLFANSVGKQRERHERNRRNSCDVNDRLTF